MDNPSGADPRPPGADGPGRWTATGLPPPQRRHLRRQLARPEPRLRIRPEIRQLRRLIRRWSAALSPYLARAPLPYGRLLESQLTVAQANLPLHPSAKGWQGARILLLSDLHAGPFLSPPRVERTFERLLALEPDLIVLTGDFVSSRADELAPFARALARLRAPAGVFAVLGNHDHHCGDPSLIVALLQAAGIRLLTNRSIRLERAGSVLTLAGIDDLNTGEPDLEASLAGADPAAPLILLSHNPDVFFDAAGRGADLVLAGHTHGGQIRLPGLPTPVGVSRYSLDDGHYHYRGAEIVVSRGLGAVGLPLRLFCAPEAGLLTLTAPGHG